MIFIMDLEISLDFFYFSIYFRIFKICIFFFYLVRLPFNVTIVTNVHKMAYKASVKGQNPPQELKVGLHSGPCLLVKTRDSPDCHKAIPFDP